MDDVLLVSALDHLAQPLEQGGETGDGKGPLGLQQDVERRAPNALHGDPKQAVGLRPEGIDVGSERVIEARGQSGLSQEALCDRGVGGALVPEHLDDRFARKQGLFRPVDRAGAAFAQLFADDEVTERSSEDGGERRGGAGALFLALRHFALILPASLSLWAIAAR